MKNKILTIAVATYNMEKYLARCLDSVLVGSILDDIDVLVVNDGSTDSSLQIAREYESRYPGTVRVIDKENRGYGSAVNMAIDQAMGKYFKTLDADDWFDGQSLVEFVKALKSTDADLIITHYSREEEQSGASRPIYHLGIEYDEVYDFEDFCVLERIHINGFAMHAMAYRTKVLRMDGFRMSHCYYSDVDYSVYPLANVKTVLFLDIVLYKYLVGREDQSVSAQGLVRHIDDHIYICKKLVAFYTARYADDDRTISFNIGYNAMNVMNNLINVIHGHLYHADRGRAKRESKELLRYLKTQDGDLYIIANNTIANLKKYKRAEVMKKMWLSLKKTS